jgi:ribonuclease HI
MTEIIEIYADGACSGNPGPGGWGVVLKKGPNVTEVFGGEIDTTNNRMEMTAAIRALESIQEKSSIHLYTDSMYLKDGITQWIQKWKQNGWKTANKQDVKNKDLWQTLDTLCQQNDITWHWVKGHAGHPDNERADILARHGVVEQMMKQTVESL